MFTVVTRATVQADNTVKIVAKGKGKQVTISAGLNGTPERHAEAAAQVLRKLDPVPTSGQVSDADMTDDGFKFYVEA